MENHSLPNDGANLSWLDKVVWVLTLQAKRWRTYEVGVFAAKLLVAGTVFIFTMLVYRIAANVIGSELLIASKDWALLTLLVAYYGLVASVTKDAETLKAVELPEAERRVYNIASWTAVVVIDLVLPLIWA